MEDKEMGKATEATDGWIIPEQERSSSRQEDGERLYGHYVTRKCDKDDGPREKMEIVKWGIDRLIKEMGAWNIIPNYDTLQFIVHEGEQSKRYLDWYADEKGKQIEETDHVMSVAIKFRGRELEKQAAIHGIELPRA